MTLYALAKIHATMQKSLICQSGAHEWGKGLWQSSENLQSSNLNFLCSFKFVRSLNAKSINDATIKIIVTEYVSVSSVSGFSKLGSEPSGFGSNGILERSVPGGISMDMVIVKGFCRRNCELRKRPLQKLGAYEGWGVMSYWRKVRAQIISSNALTCADFQWSGLHQLPRLRLDCLRSFPRLFPQKRKRQHPQRTSGE